MLCASALAGCSAIDTLNSFVPREGFRVERDVAYGPGPRRHYDLYVPDGADGSSPVAVFLYGGGWVAGSKADYLFAGQALASRGYIVAIPDYRLHPEVRFPAFLEDAAAATAAIQRRFGRPVHLVGHSAGAYNAAMLAVDGKWLAAEGLDRCAVLAGAALLAGPYDFLPLNGRSLQAIFGAAEPLSVTQPVTYADQKAPPLLLLAGSNDGTVLPRNTLALAARIRAAGGIAETKIYRDVAHADLIAAFAPPLRGYPPSLDDVDRFLRAHPRAGCG